MALLNSRSPRFQRSFDYMLPRNTAAKPEARKTEISMVVPAAHNRTPDQKGGRSEDRS